MAAFRDPAAQRHRAGRRHRAVPGLGAFPVRCRAGRWHAYRHAAAARHKPRPLLPADRPDARRKQSARTRARRRGVAARPADGARLGIGRRLAKKPTLALRYTRLLLTEYLRRQMHDLLGYGLGMEMLALLEKPEAPPEQS